METFKSFKILIGTMFLVGVAFGIVISFGIIRMQEKKEKFNIEILDKPKDKKNQIDNLLEICEKEGEVITRCEMCGKTNNMTSKVKIRKSKAEIIEKEICQRCKIVLGKDEKENVL